MLPIIIEDENKVRALSDKKLKQGGTAIINFVGDKGVYPFTNLTLLNCSPSSIIAGGMYFMSGRSDKKWINQYKYWSSSDEPISFYSLGERVLYWNKLDINNFIFNPQDQLVHAYEQIVKYGESYPVIQIYNPTFDNDFNKESVSNDDIPVSITFEWKNNKLSMFVHFRKMFYLELIQEYLFNLSLIHHLLGSWLKSTKKLKIDKDSSVIGDLNLYIDNLVTSGYPKTIFTQPNSTVYSDPSITFSLKQSIEFVDVYFSSLDNLFQNPSLTAKSYKTILSTVEQIHDDFFHDLILTLCSSKLADNYAKTLDINDFDKLVNVLESFKSDWNIPIYGSILNDKRFIIPDHIYEEMNKIKDIDTVKKFVGDIENAK